MHLLISAPANLHSNHHHKALEPSMKMGTKSNILKLVLIFIPRINLLRVSGFQSA